MNYFWEGFKSVFCFGENLGNKDLPPIDPASLRPMPKCKPPKPKKQKSRMVVEHNSKMNELFECIYDGCDWGSDGMSCFSSYEEAADYGWIPIKSSGYWICPMCNKSIKKPEDIFTEAELSDWAMRNGWKQDVVVERWKVPEESKEVK